MTRRGRTLSRSEVTAVLRRFTVLKRTWPADRVERRDPASYQRPSEVAIVRCQSPYCGHWTPRRFTYCQTCHTPRTHAASHD